MGKRWYASKGVWAGIGMIVYAATGFATGNLEMMEAIQAAIEGLGILGIRLGVGREIG